LTPTLDLDDSNVMAYRVLGVLMRDAVPTSWHGEFESHLTMVLPNRVPVQHG